VEVNPVLEKQYLLNRLEVSDKRECNYYAVMVERIVLSGRNAEERNEVPWLRLVDWKFVLLRIRA
jgi:hypothetical protein